MVRHLRVIACVLLPLSILPAACGGGGKKPPKDPIDLKDDDKTPASAPETEEDREKKRQAAAKQLVPDGSNCLPAALKEESAPRLALAAINSEAVVCAIDEERERLLGVVACWQVNVKTGDLTYQKAAPMPGRGYPAKIDDRCARGYCLPKDAKTDAKVAHLAWSPDGGKVAVSFGDDIHLFDAASKARESSFPVRGDKGVSGDPVRLFWVGDSIFVEASDGATTSPVWVFKAADGNQMGPLEGIGKGAKALSTSGGSFLVLDAGRVAISEQGLSTLTTYEVATGKRAKFVRKLPKTPCKADEAEAFWGGNTEKLPAKCKDHMTKHFGHLIGADAFAGTKNMLVLLRGERLGDLAVVNPKTLEESSVIRLPWCEEGGDGDKAKSDKDKEEKSDE
jgi:hypothetical protein